MEEKAISPLKRSFDLQMSLKNDPTSRYHRLAIKSAIDILELFEDMFPGVELDNIMLRQKSGKSLYDKINSLEIERCAKLACVIANNPHIVNQLMKLRFGKVEPINFDLALQLLRDRMDENIAPTDDSEEAIQEAQDLAGYYKTLIGRIMKLNIDTSARCDSLFFETNELFNDSRISANTKTALARIMYYKIKTGQLPQMYKLNAILKLNELYGRPAAEAAMQNASEGKVEEASSVDYLKLSEIELIENGEYDVDNPLYDNTYTSKLDRLIDEEEFLRCKDLEGMQIVISKIPRNFQTTDTELKQLLYKRNNEQDAIEIFGKPFIDLSLAERAYIVYVQRFMPDAPNRCRILLDNEGKIPTSVLDVIKGSLTALYDEGKIPELHYRTSIRELDMGLVLNPQDLSTSPYYKELDQECISRISRLFSDYLSMHSKEWLDAHKFKLVRDSVKHKNKTNGYRAEHIKFELEENPLQTLELQIKSKYVYENEKPGMSAAHSSRIGKARLLPALVNDTDLSHALLNPAVFEEYMKNNPTEQNTIRKFLRELDYLLPKYVSFEKNYRTGEYVPHIFTRIENAAKFYNQVFNDDHDKAYRLFAFITAANKYDKEHTPRPKIKRKYLPINNRKLMRKTFKVKVRKESDSPKKDHDSLDDL